MVTTSGITVGGRGRVPPETSHREISGDLPGKEMEGKKENGEEKKENRKRGRLQNEERTFFFFFFFFAFHFWNHWNLIWVYQNGNFLPEKVFHAEKKIRKNNFAPSEKYSSYTLVYNISQFHCRGDSKA